jgi:S1-C subfamily serine protease
VDATGQIHGINSGGLSRAFATTIPVETVNRTVRQLLERGYVARGWLGAAMQPVRFNPAAQRRLALESDSGLVILSVEHDGPAASAGLLVGDVIVKLGGRTIEDVDDLVDALGANDVVGRTFNLDLVRGGERVKADVLIGERPRRSA